MSAVSSLKSKRYTQSKLRDVSILALDELAPVKKLSPGQPFQLSSGVTISVLQSAAEALLEIEASAASSTSVDGQPTSELATIHSGQIIKTSAGRYVMVRHLEALILPKGETPRSPHVQQMIELALAELGSQKLSSREVPVGSLISKKPRVRPETKTAMIRLAILVSGLAVAGMIFWPTQTKNKKVRRT